MYNLTVATAHTYFVGEGAWLVHNACNSTNLSRNLGGKVSDNLQAHHLIPCEYECHPFVARAENAGWNMDDAYNGMLLPDNLPLSNKLSLPVHNGPHSGYSGEVGNALNYLEMQAYINNWNNTQALQQLGDLTNLLRSKIVNIGGGVYLR